VASEVRLESVVDREMVPRGEPVGWSVQLVSDGFLKGYQGLLLPEPEDSRTHDAGEKFASQVENDRLLNAITMEKVLVPAEEGLLEVPAVEVSWFDAAAGRYRTSRSPERRVMVQPSDLPYQQADDSGFLRNEVARLADDLAFIHNVPPKLGVGEEDPLQSPLWWALLLLPVLLLGLWRVYLVKLNAQRRNPAARRRRGALRRADEKLRDVGKTGGKGEQMSAVARALAVFVADCQNLPPASVGPAEVEEFARGLGAEGAAARLREIMDLTETWRFGGGNAGLGNDPQPANLAVECRALLADLFALLDRGSAGSVSASGTTLGVLLMLLAIGAAFWPADGLAQGDPQRLMAEAAQAYTAGDLDQALQLYRQAEAGGVQDPVLYFNLGNTHARRGELGRAITYYLRAQRLDPRDKDIARNLEYVRDHIADLELGEGELPLFIAQFVWSCAFSRFRNGPLPFWCWPGCSLPWWPMAGTGVDSPTTCAVEGWCWPGPWWWSSPFSSGAGMVKSCGNKRLWWWKRRPSIPVRPSPFPCFSASMTDSRFIWKTGSRGWGHISLGGEKLGWLPGKSLLVVNPERSVENSQSPGR
jgi:hypothetical protein